MIKFHGVKSLTKMYSEKHQVSLDEARENIKNVLEVIEEGICDPNYSGVQFINFLTLKRVQRKAKVGRDLTQSKSVIIPPRTVIKAECGKDLFDKLN